jgi:hypothetical protein
MLKQLQPLAAKVDSIALSFMAKDGAKPTLVRERPATPP